MYKLLLILKYLRHRWIAWVALGAVTLCTAMVLVVISVMGGWLDMFEKSARGMTGDVVIKTSSLSGFPYYEEMMAKAETLPEVEAASPRILTFGLINIGDGNRSLRTLGVQVMGLQLDRVGRVNRFPDTLYRQHEQIVTQLSDPKLPPEQRARLTRELKQTPTFGLHDETVVALPALPEDVPVRKETVGGIGPEGDADPLWGRVNYQSVTGRLRFRGEMSDVEQQKLADLSADAQWKKTIRELARETRWPGMIVGAGLIDVRRGSDGKIQGIDQWKYSLWSKLTVLGIGADNRIDVHATTETPYWIADHSRTQMWQYDQSYVYVPFEQLQTDLGMASTKAQDLPIVAGTYGAATPPRVDKAPEAGKYMLFRRRSSVPLAEVELKAGDPLGFKAGDGGTVSAVAGAQTFEVGPEGAEADWKIQKEYQTPARTSEVHIKLKRGADLYRSRDKIREAIQAILVNHQYSPVIIPEVQVESWDEVNAVFLSAIKKEEVMVVMLFAIISLVAVFLIFCIFYMIVAEKTKDIGIIKSVGATSTGVANIFLGYGLSIGIVGAGLGFLAAYLIVSNINELHTWVGERLHVKVWDPQVYAFETIPNKMDPKQVAIILCVAVLSSVLGALLPALRAASMHPVEALRWE